MKSGYLKTIALLSGSLLIPVHADKVQLNQLPQNVQDRIRSQIGASAEINDIDRETRNGQTRYDVGFKNNGGPQNEYWFDQDGNLLRTNGTRVNNGNIAAASTTGTSSSTDLSMLAGQKINRSELPVMVQRVVDTKLAGMDINTVQRQTMNGQVTYGIGYKHAGGSGSQQQMIVAENGTILQSSEGFTSSSAVANTTPAWNNNSTLNNNTFNTTAPGIAGRTMKYADLPQNVRTIAQANMTHGDVKQVQRLVQNGEIDYQIDFLKDNGQHQQMVISEDGRILANQIVSGTGTGVPATTQSGNSSSVNTNNPNGNLLNRVGQALFNNNNNNQR